MSGKKKLIGRKAVSRIDNRKPRVCGAAAVLLASLVALSACGGGGATSTTTGSTSGGGATTATTTAKTGVSGPSTTTGAGTVPKPIADAGEYGENIYEAAQTDDWSTAANKLASLKSAAAQIPSGTNSGDSEQLNASISALDNAVSAKDQQAAQIEANRVTLEVANLSAPYNPPVPVEIPKLDYYGRELQIWSAAKDEAKLQATASEMRQTWDTLRPSVESRDPTEAKKFDDLVAQVEAAKTPEQYGSLATPVLDEVDNLEKVFQ